MSETPAPIRSTRMDQRLKQAVRSVDVPPFLEARIRNTIRAERPDRNWGRLQIALAATAVLLAGLVVAYPAGQAWLANRSPDAYLASVSTRISATMRIGLMDHVRCAVFRKYPKDPPSTEELIKEISPQYAGLIPIVRSHVPETYRMTLAHECTFEGRNFIHLSLKDDAHKMSLVITRKVQGESFNAAGLVPMLAESGIPMYSSGVDHYQTTAFETRDFLVYFISDLSAQQNTDMMLAIGPQVKEFLQKLES